MTGTKAKKAFGVKCDPLLSAVLKLRVASFRNKEAKNHTLQARVCPLVYHPLGTYIKIINGDNNKHGGMDGVHQLTQMSKSEQQA